MRTPKVQGRFWQECWGKIEIAIAVMRLIGGNRLEFALYDSRLISGNTCCWWNLSLGAVAFSDKDSPATRNYFRQILAVSD